MNSTRLALGPLALLSVQGWIQRVCLSKWGWLVCLHTSQSSIWICNRPLQFWGTCKLLRDLFRTPSWLSCQHGFEPGVSPAVCSDVQLQRFLLHRGKTCSHWKFHCNNWPIVPLSSCLESAPRQIGKFLGSQRYTHMVHQPECIALRSLGSAHRQCKAP